MQELSVRITFDEKTIRSSNLCDRFTDHDLSVLGGRAKDAYDRDVQSRETWSLRTEAAMDLALQVQKQKNYPWPNCSNVKFPLVTIAALQFHARAYPEIVNGRDVVNARVIGEDPTGEASKIAKRVGNHMSWQLLEQDENWEADQDRALLTNAIVGCGFKKTYYNPSFGHNVSEYVQARDFVLDYWAKSVNSARVKTHICPAYRNDIYESVQRGTYRDVLDEGWFKTAAPQPPDPSHGRRDHRDGTEAPTPNDDTPYILLEQHCWFDLDQDGYEEPYIITIEESTGCVLRLVARVDRIEDVEFNTRKQIIKINANEYFTKMPFIPNPDGSIMDIGFGVLLGPLNDSVNSAINQLFDAGTMANTAGGFLGRGAKIKGGRYEFDPFGWNRVDSTGDDLRKNLVPLPVREPSGVMFNLLSLLIDYTNRISGATDMLTGVNPGQNTPAETSRAMVEQGQKVYSAIFKRIWRSMKQEFKKLYDLNSIYLAEEVRYGADGRSVSRSDYAGGGTSVVPVADPLITSEAARFQQATMVRSAARESAGYDTDAVELRYLKALGVDDPDAVFKGSANMPPPPPDPRIQIQQMRSQEAAARLQFEQMKFMADLREDMRVNNAKILELEASARKLDAEAASEPEKNRINAFNAAANTLKEQNATLNTQIMTILEGMSDERKLRNTGATGVPRLAAPSSNENLPPVGSESTGGLEGGMGDGGIYGP